MPRADESQPVSTPRPTGQPPAGVPALPGEECRTTPHTKWSEVEKWVWEKICKGQIADFNEHSGLAEPLDPRKPDSWGNNERKKRLLSPAFLEAMLLHEPWRSAISHLGVRINGALFSEPLDLSHARLKHQLWFDYSLFEGKVDFEAIRIDGFLSLVGSALSEFDLRRAVVSGGVNLNSTSFKGDVKLSAANIGGQLSAEKVRFEGKAVMGKLEVGDGLFMHNEAHFDDLVELVFAKVSGNLDLSGAQFTELDLTGTSITGELRLGSAKHHRTRWRGDGRLVLRNTDVGTIQDRVETEGNTEKDAWPAELQLDGFTYDRLGGFAGHGEESDMLARDSSWYVEHWLDRDPTYSPQPYEQLAKVLQEAGQTTMAHDVLFAGRQRARRNSTGLKWVGLILLEGSIGYGLGARYFWSLGWALLFTAIGGYVFWAGAVAPSDPDIFRLFWLSLDLLLPIATLDEVHATIVAYDKLEQWALAYLYVHKLLGWLLGSFLVAGLAGLTQK